jgi:hypothetical protein
MFKDDKGKDVCRSKICHKKGIIAILFNKYSTLQDAVNELYAKDNKNKSQRFIKMESKQKHLMYVNAAFEYITDPDRKYNKCKCTKYNNINKQDCDKYDEKCLFILLIQ